MSEWETEFRDDAPCHERVDFDTTPKSVPDEDGKALEFCGP